MSRDAGRRIRLRAEALTVDDAPRDAGRSGFRRDTPERDTPTREKLPIEEPEESFPQLVDNAPGFSTSVDEMSPHMWKTRVLPAPRKAAARLHLGGPFRLGGPFAVTDRFVLADCLLWRRRKGFRGRCAPWRHRSSQRRRLRRRRRSQVLRNGGASVGLRKAAPRGSCGAEFVSEARGRIVSAARRAARSARLVWKGRG